MEEELASALSSQLEDSFELRRLRLILVDFKARGMTKGEMLSCLESLRATCDEDSILELMDIVEGYCSSNLSIFT